MATDHEETLQQRYLREHDEYVARIESMTTGQIMALDVQLADVTAQRDQLLAALEAIIELHDSARRGSDVADTIANARAAIAAVKGDQQ